MANDISGGSFFSEIIQFSFHRLKGGRDEGGGQKKRYEMITRYTGAASIICFMHDNAIIPRDESKLPHPHEN